MNLRTALLTGFAVCVMTQQAHAMQPLNETTQMVAVGDHKIAFHITAGHAPIIVLDAGGGEDASYWKTFVPRLAKQTGSEIITYDRSGFGSSDEVAGPWNVQAATDDLEHGLKALNATHDVILVSHSLAGEIAMYLTQRHPDWFRGVVLVDATVPEVFTDTMIARQMMAYAPAIEAANKAPSSPAARQLLALAGSYEETSRAFHKAVWPVSVPAIVVVSAKTPFQTLVDAKFWREAQAQFAAASSNRKLITAARSSHDIAHDRPDVVLKAIGEFVSAACCADHP